MRSLLGAGWVSAGIGLFILIGLMNSVPLWLRIALAVLFVIGAVLVETWYGLFFRAKWRAIRAGYAPDALDTGR